MIHPRLLPCPATSGERRKRFRTLICAIAALLSAVGAATAAPPPGRILTSSGVSVGGVIEFNTDNSVSVNLTPNTFQGASHKDTYPSVSSDGKTIAFELDRNGDGHGNNSHHIWAMNSDGTHVRQLTFDATLIPEKGIVAYDQYPVISPDGTKIAFISNRYVYTFPNGYPYNGQKIAFNDVYVINTDGTGLHKVTQTQPNASGSGTNGSDVAAVAWGPDSNALVYRGYRKAPGNDPTKYQFVVNFINADSSGDSTFAVLDSTGQSHALDWSPNGRYLAVSYGGEAQNAPAYRLLIFDLIGGGYGSLSAATLGGSPNLDGSVRFSPDSSRLVYQETQGNYQINPVTLGFINLDGSNRVDVTAGQGLYDGLWWQSGAAIAQPARLTLSTNIPPDLLLLFSGQPGVEVVPTLYDAQGNVIVHAVQDWQTNTDTNIFTISNNTNIATGVNTAVDLSLSAVNGGITATPVKVMVNLPQITVSASVSRRNPGYTANITLRNSGSGDAGHVALTSATLNGIAADSLPGSNNIRAGQSILQQPSFSKTSFAPGTIAILRLQGTYGYDGKFSVSARVTIP